MPPMVDENELNMIASSTTPTMGPVTRSGPDGSGRGGPVEDLLEQGDEGREHPGRLLRMLGEQLLGELGHEGCPAGSTPDSSSSVRPAQSVVLDHEAVQSLERIVLLRRSCPARYSVVDRTDSSNRASRSSCFPPKYW